MRNSENERRVVVTGMGMISPLGNDLPTTWQKALAGESGLTTCDLNPSDIKVIGKINDFHPETVFDHPISIAGKERAFNRLKNYLSPAAQYAVVAANEALQQAGIFKNRNKSYDIDSTINPERFGVIIGSGIGGGEFVGDVKDRLNEGKTALPSQLLQILIERGASVTSIVYGLKGPMYSVSSACATGGHAINAGVKEIQLGNADIMAVGASESADTIICASLFTNTGTNSKETDSNRASRPFDEDRDGFIIGSGAGVMVIEELSHALQRGAVPLAEIIGYGETADAWDQSNPSGEGAIRAIKIAKRKSGIIFEGKKVYVSAHATGTIPGDPVEAIAIDKALTETLSIFVNALKSMIGHGLGTSGAQEGVLTVKQVSEGKILPSLHCNHPIPETDRFDLVRGKTRQVGDVDIGINNSFGFGGPNAVTIFQRYEGPVPTRHI